MDVAERMTALRELMRAAGLDAYLVPSTDPHQSEYVAKAWQRRAFISGFSGSAGTVVVTAERAGLWTDSRYYLQAEQQLAGSGIDLQRQGQPDVPEPAEWLSAQLGSGGRVGLDPWVFSAAAWDELAGELGQAGLELVGVEPDLVERVWGDDRPPMPTEPLRVHPPEVAGRSAHEKIQALREAMAAAGADAMVVAALDEVAWLLNLRGADVAYNPVFIAYVVVEAERTALFVDPDKVGDAVRAVLPEEVVVLPYESFESALAELGEKGRRVWLDPNSVNQRSVGLLADAGAHLLRRASPLPGWKAAKNEAEITGMRAAHRRDAVALVRFLHWLEGALAEGGHSELSVARRLEQFRREQERFIGPSFATISGYGPHGAIVHYSVTEESAAALRPEGLLLLDSGGQYSDGTTDVTRTLPLGPPNEEHRRAYTAVLKGHLQLSRTAFPRGTDGYQLDVLARAPLWQQGLNYGHGTGHGVGAALCVHEGPFSVSLRQNLTPLEPGNILSIEPGTYRAEGYGIRIENLALVVERESTPGGDFLGFEPLTLCPYQRALIDVEQLTAAERAQVDAYHQRVREALAPLLDEADGRWLEAACAPL